MSEIPKLMHGFVYMFHMNGNQFKCAIDASGVPNLTNDRFPETILQYSKIRLIV